jgi:hypothetical protein
MRNLLTLFCILVCSGISYGQWPNMVPNGNFETFTQCPTATGQSALCTGWSSVNQYSPDYYNVCATPASFVSVPTNGYGSELPASGNAYMGVFYDGGFFVECIKRTINTLTVGRPYEVSFSISTGDGVTAFSDDVDVQFGVPGNVFVDFQSYGFIDNKNGWQRLSKTIYITQPHSQSSHWFCESTTIPASGFPERRHILLY